MENLINDSNLINELKKIGRNNVDYDSLNRDELKYITSIFKKMDIEAHDIASIFNDPDPINEKNSDGLFVHIPVGKKYNYFLDEKRLLIVTLLFLIDMFYTAGTLSFLAGIIGYSGECIKKLTEEESCLFLVLTYLCAYNNNSTSFDMISEHICGKKCQLRDILTTCKYRASSICSVDLDTIKTNVDNLIEKGILVREELRLYLRC